MSDRLPKILLVEDDSDLRETIGSLLLLNDFDVKMAGRGSEALDMLRSFLPDLIICDVVMEGMTGYEVLENVRADSRTAAIPFIFLTARANPESMRLGMAQGADDYLTKPVSEEDLIKAVRARLKRSEVVSRALVDLTRMRGILDAARNIALVTLRIEEDQASIVEFSVGAEVLFGFFKEEVLGKPLGVLKQDPEVERSLVSRLRAIRDGSEIQQLESVLSHRSGEKFQALCGLYPLSGVEEASNLGLWMTLNINERKQFEEQMIQARHEAESASQAKSEFLANISHEIRTPMNAVIGFTDLLMKTNLDDKQREFVGIARESAKNLMFLLDQILDFSKIEAGKLAIEPYPILLREIIEEVCQLFSVRAQEKGIIIDREFRGEVDTEVVGDGERIRQVLQNLVSNAVKFTNHGRVLVFLLMESLTPGKMEILLSVEDSGVGVPPEKEHLLFQKFSQTDATTTRKYGGTGLGLAICKSLVELMGGRITYRRGSVKGAIFTFSLTLPMVSGVRGLVGSDPGVEVERPLPDKLAGTCLVVDDDSFNRDLMREIFLIVGVIVEMAENGQQAIDMVEKKRYDVVFMDCLMPGVDGFQATEQIRVRDRELGRKTCIIGVTALAQEENRQRCLECGMDEVITKPLETDEIIRVLKKHLTH